MKKALIWKQGALTGKIHRIDLASEIDSWSHHLKAKMEVVEVPAQLEDKQLSELQAVLVGQSYQLQLDPITKKQADLEAAYKAMSEDIYAEMALVFGTTSAESANAYKQTWEAMLEDPTAFAAIGLTARFDRGEYLDESQATIGIDVGDALNTAPKITAYAQGCLAAVKAYALSRMQRIEQYKQERAAIEAQ